MPTDKEPFYDFADTTKADSEKWKAFRRDTMHQTMKSYGPIGALTDPDPLDADDEPGSELWGLKKICLNSKSCSPRTPRKPSMSSKRHGFKLR